MNSRLFRLVLALFGVLAAATLTACGPVQGNTQTCMTESDYLHRSSSVPGTMNVHTWTTCSKPFQLLELNLQIQVKSGSNWYGYSQPKTITFRKGSSGRAYKGNMAAPCGRGTYRLVMNWTRVTMASGVYSSGFQTADEVKVDPCG